jgi:hypothetical protein
MIHLLEHLSKQEGIELIEKAEQWAKKKVIIAGPNGFIPQDAYDANPYQRHVSGWTVEDFESVGFAVCGFHGLRFLRGELHELRFRPKSFFSRLSDASELVTFSHPAHHHPLRLFTSCVQLSKATGRPSASSMEAACWRYVGNNGRERRRLLKSAELWAQRQIASKKESFFTCNNLISPSYPKKFRQIGKICQRDQTRAVRALFSLYCVIFGFHHLQFVSISCTDAK